MSQVLERNWRKELEGLLISTPQNLPIPYPDIDIIIIKEERKLALAEKLRELRKAELKKQEEAPIKLTTNYDDDSSLIEDAYDLKELIKKEWENIVLAMPSGIDFEYDLRLKVQKKQYYKFTVFNRAWEVYEIIKSLSEGEYTHQPKAVFGNYEEIFTKLNNSKELVACRYLQTLRMKLERCLPRRVDIIEPLIRVPDIVSTPE